MQLVDKAKALGANAVDKLAAKRDAVTETVGEIIDRGKEVAHHLVDKVTSVVHGGPNAEAAVQPQPAMPSVTKQRGRKKPRAERRRARRLARAQA